MFVLEQTADGWIVRNAETGASTIPMAKVRAQRVLKDLNKSPQPKKSQRVYTAQDVLVAASKAPGYFGGSGEKAYVSDVLKTLPGLSKKELFEMHRRGEIELSRLDLVAAAREHGELGKVEASEIHWPGSGPHATMHLIQKPSAIQKIGGFLGR